MGEVVTAETFIENGVKKFICEDCGNSIRIDTMTKCKDCGAWYRMRVEKMVPGVDYE